MFPINRPVEVQFPVIPVPVKQVLRRLGYPPGHQIDAGMRQMIDSEIEASRPFFHFQGIYSILQIDSCDSNGLSFHQSSFIIESRQVAGMLKQADRVALFMVTLGDALEQRVKELFNMDEPARALILDATGSETVDALADYLHWQVLSKEAEKANQKVTPRFSPGYGDWRLEIQSEICRVCRGDRIGISVTDSSLMIPRKSVSAVLGFVPV